MEDAEWQKNTYKQADLITNEINKIIYSEGLSICNY